MSHRKFSRSRRVVAKRNLRYRMNEAKFVLGEPPPSRQPTSPVAYDPGLDNCAGGCKRNDNRRVLFSYFGLNFACPGCFEEVFGGPPDPSCQPVIALTPDQIQAGAAPC